METVRKTIGELFSDVADANPNREALVHLEAAARYNYALLAWEVERAAKGFLKLGLRPGEAAAVYAANIPEWIIAFLALARIGVLIVPIDPSLGPADLGYILADSQAKTIVIAPGPDDEVTIQTVLEARENASDLTSIIAVADKSEPEMILWTEFTAGGADLDRDIYGRASSFPKPEDPCAIMYTSGTTGRPKGVVLDHLGLVNKSIQSAARQKMSAEDRFCLSFPLFHMFGNTCIALTGIAVGASLIMPSRSFQPQSVIDCLKKEECTAVFGSPSMFSALIDSPFSTKKAWRSVKKGTIGGAPCPMELMKRLVNNMGIKGLVSAYGITEASSWITMTDPNDSIERRVSTVGRALDCCRVKIVDPRTGEELSPGSQGEICTSGFLMKGYHRLPFATKAAIDSEGWFHTGDLGEMDAYGYVRITGRMKDVITRGNKEIIPVEIEEIFYRLGQVSEVQVFGFPDPEMGQEVAAWVKLKDGADLTIEELAEFARKSLPEDKMPHYFKVVSAFPTTKSGKVQKFKLSEMAAEEYGRKGPDGQPLYTCS